MLRYIYFDGEERGSMGIFDNYFGTKPGKGVRKVDVVREKEKVTFNGFFKIYKRKFWQMVQLNLLSFIFFLPLIVLFVMFASQFIVKAPEMPLVINAANKGADNSFVALWNVLNISSNNSMSAYVMQQDIISRVFVSIFFIAIPLIAIGPIQAGFTYILQSFIKEKPVFLTHDFFKKAKTNFWQSLFVSVVDLLITALIFVALYFYNEKSSVAESSVFWTMGLAVMAIILVVYLIMHIYIYPVLTTFNVNLKQLYRNSFFLAMTSFFPALLILLINIAVIFLVYILSGNLNIMILLVAGFIFSTIGLINNYFGHKYIKYHLLDPALAAAEEKRKNEEEKIFND